MPKTAMWVFRQGGMGWVAQMEKNVGRWTVKKFAQTGFKIYSKTLFWGSLAATGIDVLCGVTT